MKRGNCNFVAKTKDILGVEKELPLKHIDFHVEIVGARAIIQISQRFENDLKTAIDVEYLFPILSRSCLLEFVAATDDQTFVGVVGEKEKVAAASKKLKEKGVTHAVAQNFQEFKDIVKVMVSNLQPKQSLLIQIKLSLMLDVISQSTFRFRLPVVLLERLKEEVREKITDKQTTSKEQENTASIQHSVECGYTFGFEMEVYKESSSDIELHKLEPFTPEEIKVSNLPEKKVFTLIQQKEPPNKDVFFIFKRTGVSKIKTVGFSQLDNILSAQLVHSPKTEGSAFIPKVAYGNFVLKSIGKTV